jgi:PAS domain S-box-containing protein
MLLPSILSEVLIEQIQTRGLRCVSPRTPIAAALQILPQAPAQVLGIWQQGQIQGLVTSQSLIQTLASGGADCQSPISEICQPTQPITLAQLADLAGLLRQRDLLRQCPLPVLTAEGEAVGLLLLEDVRQLLDPEVLLDQVRVRDLNLAPGLTVPPEVPIKALAQKMSLPALVVSEAGRDPLGWVDVETVLKAIATDPHWHQRTAADLLMPLPEAVALSDPLRVAYNRMAAAPWLPVTTDQGQFCGVLRREQLQTLWDPHEYLQSHYSLEQTVLEQTLELSQLNHHQRQLRQTLARSESRYQAVVENAPVGISQADAAGQFIQVNRQFCDLLGYTEAELLEKRYQEVTHPDDLGKSTAEIARLLAGEVPFLVLEKRYLHKDGSPIWVQVTLTCLVDPDGTVVSDLAVIEDIRDRKQAEAERQQATLQQRRYLQELAAWQRRYEMAGQASEQVLFEYDIAANRDLWGPNTQELLGYAAADMPQGLAEFMKRVHPEDRPAFQKVIDNDTQATQAYRVEYRFLCGDGSYRWMEERAQTFYDEHHQPRYVIGVIEDVCDRKQAELELTRAKEAADAANRAKSVFIANMSHELRTPLNIILGFTQVLQQDPHLALTQRETLNIILQSGDHLLSLINDVLHVAKIEANRIVLHREDLHLTPFLNSLALMLQGQAAAKGLLLRTEVAPDFPAYIQIDQGKLRQILINLLGNAIKFTQTGWVQLRCVCLPSPPKPTAGTPDELWLRFEVEDTGIGISAAELEVIFEPFSQISQRSTLSEGTGLGLTISRQYAELMGGQITVRSQPGQGSIFTLDLPCRPLVASGVPLPLPGSTVKILPGQTPRRILVVDDVPTNCKVLTKLLNPLPWPIREAGNGQEAVAIWRQWRPDLIWMDLRMPIMDGYEAIRQIRQLEADELVRDPAAYHRTQIIVLTAGTLEDEVGRSLAAGADETVLKPLCQQRLFELLGKHLRLAYTYESLPTCPVPIEPAPLAELLSEQPADWLQALHYAALCCDDSQVNQLLQSLPPESQAIAHSLQPLLYEFRFDAIAQVLQPLLPPSFGLIPPA